MFKKILIANRGEIALRVIRACKELGIRTVAIHSDVDTNAMHVRAADEHVCIGPAEDALSYRNIPNVLSAAEVTGAEAIHPGYGFLAENAHFAEVCESIGVKFIGPTSENIAVFGDKAKAREILGGRGIPVLPGSPGELRSESEALEAARKIGFPVIIKACAGGGGRGMRVVNKEEELVRAFQAAQTEAKSTFGNEGVYLERYFLEPRHIEVQVLADERGRVVSLGERDCSIQRRYQKLVEETPSPAVDDRLRREIGRVATEVVKAVHYRNAGTVEFLLDKDQNFYFMEVNARIQVEHPVTEMVTGIDLIKEQIRIAAGFPLAFRQQDVRLTGHSFECRINAECPEKFTPCPGLVTRFRPPGGFGVRVDSAMESQSTVVPNYDSLIAKLITHGQNREEAMARMRRALDEFVIEGIKTTIPLHVRIFNDAEFQKGRISTGFLERLLAHDSV
ncbi:MAG: acetyl-CoA carboxylase biotin carboxylase subunit [Nitrospirae bacterium]|nr:MAG: acetyl-CoA carboxylase biotin carboxylase subunit [Nitrospirae bacterium 13_2_20CM_2_62_8]OLC42970.1 MAG: acetyl-CoA carboxylase biotin carboxylase subunit [Nitrospirae bacterium 13_1_40CM_4_62_6]OLC80090.1 MAG: acetyl-CoA carboxylase biotin carboxylase subunit [Nitrospirae bacterium 13_1_40CM_3_62_11]OLD75237.1 MAG: acetyl-CoA carboxylase biotin carboxylase subunit [Nitrospirae bacterium 13_1_20CM_4_62_6]TLY43914.1 MAG: acetyl-CoA carboxylase biotin carboxylase subunit [Nitrospirota ba